MPSIVAVPLTESQKFQLRLGLGLPLAIGGGMLWLFFALSGRFGQNLANTKAMLALVFGAIGAVVLYVAARNLRDLLRGSANVTPEDFRDSLELVGSGAVAAAPLISHRMPLERVQEAFEAQLDARASVKVLVTTS